MKILVTGAAGFIGYSLIKKLLDGSIEIVGIDSLNDYYSPTLKYQRLENLGISIDEIRDDKPLSNQDNSLKFIKANIESPDCFADLEGEKFDVVVNLAAQVGIRYSLENPKAYIDSNLNGFFNVLEYCRSNKPKLLIFASSSSVYGLNEKTPYSESDFVDHPISLYAATKKSNELMAHVYSHLYGINAVGLRFFTVYGPWGRPDMAYFKFAKKMVEGKEIEVYNNGDMKRDFTYIDDIINGIERIIKGFENNPNKKQFEIYNIGNNRPVNLLYFIKLIEKELGIEANKKLLPMQPGDVYETYADISKISKDYGYKPSTPVEIGIKKFIDWFKKYNR